MPGDRTPSTNATKHRFARWPWIIVALLAGHATLMMVAVSLAKNDRSFVVIPDYYNRSLQWDHDQAQRRASQQLGWQIKIESAETIDPTGQRDVAFTLLDREGKPIHGASIQLDYFHGAHAAERSHLTLTESTTPGRYEATLPMRYSGFWQFDLSVDAQQHHFVQSTTQEVFTVSGGRQ
jgi:nitrogen fixation protein FixH